MLPTHPRHLLACLIALAAFTGCSSERYHKIWSTLDPAGYKHAHSAVFNPGKYKKPAPSASREDVTELDISQ